MNCVRCGSPLREGATFCTNCGLPTVPPQMGTPGASSPLDNDPTIRSASASGPAGAGPSSSPYDPTIRARPPSQPTYPASSGQMPGASDPALVPAAVPLDAPTVASSAPASSPYGYPPAGAGSVPYGAPPDGSGVSPYVSTVYGAPSQPYPPAPPPEFLVPPPPPAPPLMPRIFGPDADAVGARPHTRTQAWLLRNIPFSYVVSKWFMAIGGAIIALAAGLLLTLLVQVLLGNGIAGALGASETLGTGSASNSVLNPGLLDFFALEHQVTLILHVSSNAVTVDESYTFPLLGLLLAPALALVLGGFLAASSDFQRHPRYSIARGALIGPFYAILLLLLSFLSSSTLDNSSLGLPSGSTATISPNTLQECLFGLLWGTLFGALGGWIQLTGRRFVTVALPSLQTLRSGRIAGALTGAGVALICGILLFTGFEFAYLVYNIVDTAGGGGALNTAGVPTDGLNTWAVLRLGLSLGPGAAIWLFALGTGAPINFSINGASSMSVGFIGATSSPAKSSALYYLFALGPAISYFAGGRVAARVARAQRTGDAFTAGALMALPLSILLALAALLLPVAVNLTVSGGGGQSLTFSEGPTFWGTFLAVLVGGAIVGGIGGASAVGMPGLGSLPRLLLIPLRPIGFLLSRLLDALTGRPRGEKRSGAMLWFYDSVLLAVILGILLLVAIPVAPVLASSGLPFSVVRGIILWLATLLVGLPLLFLIGALVTAFSAPAVQATAGAGAQAPGAVPGSSPIFAPPSQPFPPGAPVYGTGPLPPGMPAAPGSQPFPSGAYAPPGSQPYPPAGTPSQPYPPGGYAPPGSQPFAPPSQPFPPGGPPSQPYPPGGYAPPGSQPYPPAGPPSDDATITSPDTPTVRSSQPYPPAGNTGEPPARQ